MYTLLKLKRGQQNACPFPHKKSNGKLYYEKEPSCGITESGAFHCLACGRGYTDEAWFTAAYLNVSYRNAERYLETLKNSRLFLPKAKEWVKYQNNLKEALKDEESDFYKYLKELELLDVVDDARLGIYLDRITYPYFYKGMILNLTEFRPGETPKYRNSRGALSGIVGTTKRFNPKLDYIIIAAGEKDMLELNKHGFNAVTLLGGEKAKPIFAKSLFKNKKVYIAYDNDKAGFEGAKDLASWLYNVTREIKILNLGNTDNEHELKFTDVVEGDKEDITDFFVKYNRNDIDLWNIIDNTKWYQPPALENESTLKLIKENYRVLKMLRESLNKEKK